MAWMFIFIYHLFFCWLLNVFIFNPRKDKLFFLLFQGANYLRVSCSGEKIFNFVCDFSLSLRDGIFFFIRANPTSLICFNSLPIPSIIHILDIWGVTGLFFHPRDLNLPHHLTNSCFSLSIYFVILLDCVTLPSLRWMLIRSLHPRLFFYFHPHNTSVYCLFTVILKSILIFILFYCLL